MCFFNEARLGYLLHKLKVNGFDLKEEAFSSLSYGCCIKHAITGVFFYGRFEAEEALHGGGTEFLKYRVPFIFLSDAEDCFIPKKETNA